MAQVIRIGNASGFWGDHPDAPRQLVEQQGDLDYLTLDYLAELSMSILAQQQARGGPGYPADFVDVVRSLAPAWLDGAKFRLVTNAGGLDPLACANACAQALRDADCRPLRIAAVTGDDVLQLIRTACDDGNGDSNPLLENLDTEERLGRDVPIDRVVTANAYLGAAPIVDALHQDADIVITGRVADPSLTVAPCVAHFGWAWSDVDRLAGATVAGHLIECGTQVTGGISTDWLDMPDVAHIGYPVAEVDVDGHCIITKPDHTGGRVDEMVVKEQLLYEVLDPCRYLSPDVTVSLAEVHVAAVGPDRVRIDGATGSRPPLRYKVTATYHAGYRAAGTLVIHGRDAVARAQRCAQMIHTRLRDTGAAPQHWLAECLGAGDAVPVASARIHGEEVVLRVAVADARRDVVERFSREMSPLITAGPPGTTGYGEGRPRVHEVFGYWPCLVDRSLVSPRVTIVEV